MLIWWSHINKPTRIWLILLFASAIQYTIAETASGSLSNLSLSVLALTVGYKSHRVIADFLLLRKVTSIWKTLIYAWLIITLVAIAIIYLLT